MNPIIPNDNQSNVPWPTSDERVTVPDTSMLPGSDATTPAAADLVKNAAKGAHDTIDRLADSAGPAVRQIGDSVTAAAEALNLKTDQLRETGDAWAEEARAAVRSNPLVALAAAVALGVVIARLTR